MIICVCKNISEDKVIDALKQGHRGEDVLKRLGVGSDCGICMIDAVTKVEAAFLASQSKNSSKKSN